MGLSQRGGELSASARSAAVDESLDRLPSGGGRRQARSASAASRRGGWRDELLGVGSSAATHRRAASRYVARLDPALGGSAPAIRRTGECRSTAILPAGRRLHLPPPFFRDPVPSSLVVLLQCSPVWRRSLFLGLLAS